MNNTNQVIEFIKEIENLKSVTRTAWTKTGRRESTAEHSWRLAMLLMVLEEDFKDVDINKAIKMSLVHDLGELYDGDISAKLQGADDNKSHMEERAMKRMLTTLPESLSEKIYDLWKEYNECSTKEAKLVKAMDKLETIVQHNQGKNTDDFDYEFNLKYGSQYFEDNGKLKLMRNIIDEDTKLSMESKILNKY
ncbi:HD domain-containing protein [Terrisporobacter petrolearius]|uniref:HD domain-containing protein n=1 Tax=Terrisporobacter petrolearius TaxID=1460447 RepID=UPI001D1665A9|nr:HD domain-containing protein [Terrisporobacter petrolearius]MCC3864420.1 HD domain-containing protein [Terrisporobacter petrolearius]